MEHSPDFNGTLETSLERVIGFLQFAEAKNAALLAFTSAWVAALSAVLTTASSPPDSWTRGLQWGVALFALASIAPLLSFIPRLDLPAILRRRDVRAPNLLFFGDIAGRAPAELLSDLSRAYGTTNSRYAEDLAQQIFANSVIAVRKFRLFNYGACLCIFGILAVAHPAILTMFGK